jgi:hypothetical protein
MIAKEVKDINFIALDRITFVSFSRNYKKVVTK